MKVIEKLKSVYNKKGSYFLISELWKRIMPIRFVWNLNVMEHHYEENAYRFLEKKYMPLLNKYKQSQTKKEHSTEPPIIWICWLQGIENAPELVKKCYESVLKNSKGCKVILIDNENLKNYIEIPDYIEEHLRKKHMQFAQYSDYLRLSLLSKYGGVWIDATAMLSEPIPEILLSKEIFCFKTSYLSVSKSVCSSWFLIAQKDNLLINQVKYLMEEYWKREKHLCNYYLFHLLFSIVVKYDENNRMTWKNVPYIHNVDAHMLQFELFDEFNEERFREICKKSFVHKLTYKFKDQNATTKQNTFYSHIINNPI